MRGATDNPAYVRYKPLPRRLAQVSAEGTSYEVPSSPLSTSSTMRSTEMAADTSEQESNARRQVRDQMQAMENEIERMREEMTRMARERRQDSPRSPDLPPSYTL
ncbi:hypothetical protein JAAARDRAFT_29402 [Jaapia argillacea MUCL 33604]|uniref:Uncharacterized protein n=1 Tax=Jaapia argillacea MUCL 33604 TaxID=933084 RepID=A0A067Q8K0_9AGAM|nr:hypothetical protein JAAARDRAFT_29402 [Jaapia argillacea MUCL 33604]